MIKFEVGLVWFVALRLLIGAVLGIAAPFIENPDHPDPDAMFRVQDHFGWLMTLVALGLAVEGTRRGLLPGSRKNNEEPY
jgi:hypothetical protein